MVDPEDLAREFERAFGRSPRLYRAPGRVNLIGEHTDYNDGFVMPMALDRSTWVAAAPRDDSTIVVRSREYGETVTIDLEAQRSARLPPSAREQHEGATVDAPKRLWREGGQPSDSRSPERLAPHRHWSDYVHGVAAVLAEGARRLSTSARVQNERATVDAPKRLWRE